MDNILIGSFIERFKSYLRFFEQKGAEHGKRDFLQQDQVFKSWMVDNSLFRNNNCLYPRPRSLEVICSNTSCDTSLAGGFSTFPL